MIVRVLADLTQHCEGDKEQLAYQCEECSRGFSGHNAYFSSNPTFQRIFSRKHFVLKMRVDCF